MTEFNWTTIRAKAVDLFDGELPHAQTEAEIIEVFHQHPATVVNTIEQVAISYSHGQIRSGWAIVRKRLSTALEPVQEITVTGNRDKAIDKARTWILNAGIHFDREQDVLEWLYDGSATKDSGGYLRAFRDDDQLRATMLELWRSKRPIGEQLDAEAAERAQDFKTRQAALQVKLQEIKQRHAAKQAEEQRDHMKKHGLDKPKAEIAEREESA